MLWPQRRTGDWLWEGAEGGRGGASVCAGPCGRCACAQVGGGVRAGAVGAGARGCGGFWTQWVRVVGAMWVLVPGTERPLPVDEIFLVRAE